MIARVGIKTYTKPSQQAAIEKRLFKSIKSHFGEDGLSVFIVSMPECEAPPIRKDES